MNKQSEEIKSIGIIGLGFMGRGIASCLVRSGYNVIACSKDANEKLEALNHIASSYKKFIDRNTISESETVGWEKRFKYANSVDELSECEFIIETVGESLELKKQIYKAVESVVGKDVVIATNTSSILISLLQKDLNNKKRFIGMHWAEPAEITKYLEISRGEETADYAVEIGRRIGERCGKQPTILNFDIPGLISNRLMYAMIREATHLVEIGVADIETIDRSFRNDIGWWATLCGPFRWMDLTGIPIYGKVTETIFPDLSNTDKVPELIKKKIETNSKFYNYKDDEEKEWEAIWTDFTLDISELVKKHEKKAKF